MYTHQDLFNTENQLLRVFEPHWIDKHSWQTSTIAGVISLLEDMDTKPSPSQLYTLEEYLQNLSDYSSQFSLPEDYLEQLKTLVCPDSINTIYLGWEMSGKHHSTRRRRPVHDRDIQSYAEPYKNSINNALSKLERLESTYEPDEFAKLVCQKLWRQAFKHTFLLSQCDEVLQLLILHLPKSTDIKKQVICWIINERPEQESAIQQLLDDNTTFRSDYHKAAYEDDLEYFETNPLSLKKLITIQDSLGLTPLHYAAARGHLSIIQYYATDHIVVKELETLLHFATRHGHFETATWLLEQQFNPSAHMSEQNNTPLLCAAAGGHINLMELLVDHGVSLCEKNDSYYDALRLATDRGHLAAVKWLLNKKEIQKQQDNVDQWHNQVNYGVFFGPFVLYKNRRLSIIDCAILSKNIDLVHYLLVDHQIPITGYVALYSSHAMVQYLANNKQFTFPQPNSSVLDSYLKLKHLTKNLALLGTLEKLKCFIKAHKLFKGLNKHILIGARNYGLTNDSYIFAKEANVRFDYNPHDVENTSGEIQLFEILTEMLSYSLCVEKLDLVKYLLELGIPLQLPLNKGMNVTHNRRNLIHSIKINLKRSNKLNILLKFLESNAKELQIRSLNLNDLNLNHECLTSICHFLSNTSKLHHLSLGKNGIEDHDLLQLANVLKSNNTLLTINLEENHFTETALIGLVDMLKNNQQLQQLKLDSTVTNNPFYHDLEALLKRNRHYINQGDIVAYRILNAARNLFLKPAEPYNPINMLPTELQCHILSYLDEENLLSESIIYKIVTYAQDASTLGNTRQTFLNYINEHSQQLKKIQRHIHEHRTHTTFFEDLSNKRRNLLTNFKITVGSLFTGIALFTAASILSKKKILSETILEWAGFAGIIIFLGSIITSVYICFKCVSLLEQKDADFSYAPETTTNPTNDNNNDCIINISAQTTPYATSSFTGLTNNQRVGDLEPFYKEPQEEYDDDKDLLLSKRL